MTKLLNARYVTGLLAVATLTASLGFALAPKPQSSGASQIVTLYANDDLMSSFSFSTGGPGARVSKGEMILDGADIVFHLFEENMLSFGFVHNELANIIDLGDFYIPGNEKALDRSPKFDLSLVHTLFRDGAQFAYRGYGNKVFHNKEANRILHSLPPEGIYHIEPKINHTYLFRSKKKGADGAELFAKFQVIDFRPGRSLTIRWAPIPTSG